MDTGQVDAWMVGALLTSARIVPTCGLVALASRALVPWPVALSLTVALTAAFAAPVEVPLSARVMFGELAVGLVLALATGLPVLALGWAARLAERTGPGPSERPGPLARLYALVAAFTFLSLGGHRALLMALSASLRDLPVGSARASLAFALGLGALTGEALAFAVALALPLMLSLWVAQAAVAIGARALRLAPAPMDGPLRGPLTVLVSGALLAPLAARLPDAVRAGLSTARNVIERMGP